MQNFENEMIDYLTVNLNLQQLSTFNEIYYEMKIRNKQICIST